MNQLTTIFKRLFDTSGWLFRRPLSIFLYMPIQANKTRQNNTQKKIFRKKEKNINSELNDLFNSIDEALFPVNMIALELPSGTTFYFTILENNNL